MKDDRDLIECFHVIHELYLDSCDPWCDARDHVPSLAENREALRLFARIGNCELRTAMRILMRTLARPVTSDGPNVLPRTAANKPN